MNCPYCKKPISTKVTKITERKCPHCSKTIRLIPPDVIKADEKMSVSILKLGFDFSIVIGLVDELIKMLGDFNKKLRKQTIPNDQS